MCCRVVDTLPYHWRAGSGFFSAFGALVFLGGLRLPIIQPAKPPTGMGAPPLPLGFLLPGESSAPNLVFKIMNQ